jgi:hypothetical protein
MLCVDLRSMTIEVRYTASGQLRQYSPHWNASDVFGGVSGEVCCITASYAKILIHGRIQGVQGCAPPSGRSALFVEECPFCRRVPFSMFAPLLLETHKNAPQPVSDKSSLVRSGWSNKALVHCTKPEKNLLFLQLRKTWNLIPRCQENAY